MSNKNQVWGKYELKNEEAWSFTGGFVKGIIKRLSNGWIINSEKNIDAPEQLVFENTKEFVTNGSETVFQTGRSDILHVSPSLPVKPVVLRNNKNIKISPKQSIKLYVAIPLNFQFCYSQADLDHLLAEIEMEKLSDTWFGETDNGEPAFSIGQHVALQPAELLLKNHEALCPVKITNNSNHLLEVERLIIRVENLALYSKNNQLITSRVFIDFKGQDQISNLHYSTDKRIHGEHPVLVANPRNAGTKSILGKSFHFIKHFTQ